MKKLKPYIIATAILYFCFAFPIWNFNLAQWSESKRLGFIIYWLIFLPIIFLLKEIIKDYDDS